MISKCKHCGKPLFVSGWKICDKKECNLVRFKIRDAKRKQIKHDSTQTKTHQQSTRSTQV